MFGLMSVKSPPSFLIQFFGFFLVSITIGLAQAYSQTRVELAGYAGYQFWGGVEGFLPDGTPIEAEIDDATNWGGAVGYRVEETIRFELSYLNQATSISITQLGTGVPAGKFDITIQYIQAGAIYEAPSAGRSLTPYGGLTVGMVNFNPEGTGTSSAWRLAFGFNGGLKIYLAENFGLRMQGSLLLPIQWSSGGVFCGGSGCAVAISGGTAILQGAVTGGVFVEI